MSTPSKNPPGILKTLNRCPPFVIYYLSHHGRGERLSIKGLVKGSGLAHRTFTRTSRMLCWDSVKLGVMEKFCGTCGLSPLDEERIKLLLEAEMSSATPFEGLEGHSRKLMMRKFDKLCARAVIADGV